MLNYDVFRVAIETTCDYESVINNHIDESDCLRRVNMRSPYFIDLDIIADFPTFDDSISLGKFLEDNNIDASCQIYYISEGEYNDDLLSKLFYNSMEAVGRPIIKIRPAATGSPEEGETWEVESLRRALNYKNRVKGQNIDVEAHLKAFAELSAGVYRQGNSKSNVVQLRDRPVE